jgi:dihydropteroate synthase
MGVLNVTPDSFSDGGQFLDLDAALRQAEKMSAEGAAIIDIGGESTKPGAAPVSAQEQIDRVLPVIEALLARIDLPISIDTSSPEVVTAAVNAGAGLINDVRALSQPGMLARAASLGVPVCLMHMQGEPDTMQQEPHYGDVVAEVTAWLKQRAKIVEAAGVPPEHVLLDPGFGFGKLLAHNLALMKRLSVLVDLGYPLLVGVSRKSMLGTLLDRPPQERLAGGVALAALAVAQGAKLIRTHDVAATVDAVRVAHAVAVEGEREA